MSITKYVSSAFIMENTTHKWIYLIIRSKWYDFYLFVGPIMGGPVYGTSPEISREYPKPNVNNSLFIQF